MGAVILSLTAWITIPFAVPFTMQTFGVAFVLFALGGKRGTLSVVVYIALGLLGVPVFSGFNSGFGAILGATGGYIIGFALWGCLYLALESFFTKRRIIGIAVSFAGLAASYALGTAWYAVWLGEESAFSIFVLCVLPYIIPDVVKILLAYVVSVRVKKAIGD
jgi:biotin transport system substrate-specific component